MRTLDNLMRGAATAALSFVISQCNPANAKDIRIDSALDKEIYDNLEAEADFKGCSKQFKNLAVHAKNLKAIYEQTDTPAFLALSACMSKAPREPNP